MNALRACFLLLAAATATACTAGTSSDESTGNAPGGATGQPGETGDPAPAAPPASEYVVDCSGKATKTAAVVTLELAPKCVGGAPGTRCGGSPCDADDARLSYAPPFPNCVPGTVYLWDGTACVGHPTSNAEGQLHCAGSACASLYASQASCESAHSSCMTFK